MIAASALEVLFVGKCEQSIFSKEDKKELVTALKKHFGNISEKFEKLIRTLRDPRKFPCKGRTELMIDGISRVTNIEREELRRELTALFALRNSLAHMPRVNKFDGRRQLNFGEMVLVAAVRYHMGQPYEPLKTPLFGEGGIRESY